MNMKRASWIGVAAWCGLMFGVCGVVTAQPGDKPVVPAKPDLGKAKDAAKDALKGAQPEKKAGAPEGIPADKQAEMEAWMKASTPGEMHAKMAKEIGTWTRW